MIFLRTFAKTAPKNVSNIRTVATSAKVKQQAAALTVEDLSVVQCPVRKALSSVGNFVSESRCQTKAKVAGRSFDEVPGPKGFPVVGTLLDYFKKDGLSFNKMFEAYRQRSLEYGPIYKEKIATISTVVISNPDEYGKVMRAEGKLPIRRAMEPMEYYRIKKGIDLGLVNAQGQEWYKYRTVLSKKMLKPKEVQEYCEPMNEVTDDFMVRLNKIRNSNSEVNDLEKEIFKWAMESIGTVLFEERIGCFQNPPPQQAQDFIDNLVGYFRLMQPLMYNVPTYKLYPTKLWKQFETYADNVMAIGRKFINKKIDALREQMENGRSEEEENETSQFLTYLISQHSLTAEQATSTAVDLLMAAVETTSNAAIWTLYCLAQNPEVQEQIYRELQKVLPDNGPITPETLTGLQYVKACLKEALRIYPITYATSRILQEDVNVAGYNIPAGTHVQANVYGMGRNPELFADPEDYQPQRWLGECKGNNAKILYNLVWGHGARMCIGRRFAEQELHMVLTKIIQNFRLEYHHEDVKPTLNTVMTPDRPVRITFVPRVHK